MSPEKRSPAIVAELGRPETPEETAARKAQNSRNHRDRQTINNLIYALIATLAVVLVIVLIVPRATPNATKPVNYSSIAEAGRGAEPNNLVNPKLPHGFTSNSAELKTKTSDGVDTWYIGLITPSQQYIGINQGFNANATWLSDQVNQSLASGTTTIDGVQWTIYNNRDSGRDNGNVDYALTAQSGRSTYVVAGTADDSEFDTVARALGPDILANGASR
jgi:Protein of unknown function (DUF4245)